MDIVYEEFNNPVTAFVFRAVVIEIIQSIDWHAFIVLVANKASHVIIHYIFIVSKQKLNIPSLFIFFIYEPTLRFRRLSLLNNNLTRFHPFVIFIFDS